MVTETFTEEKLGNDSALYFTSCLLIALSKILSHSKTIRKSAKNLSIFVYNDLNNLLCYRFFTFLGTYVLKLLKRISITYN